MSLAPSDGASRGTALGRLGTGITSTCGSCVESWLDVVGGHWTDSALPRARRTTNIIIVAVVGVVVVAVIVGLVIKKRSSQA
jgi:hypothetical protein